MTAEEAAKEQDRQRTARSFISFLTVAAGLDGSNAYADGAAYNAPNQYQTVTPYGVSVTGQPISNLQSSAAGGLTISPALLLLIAVGGAAFWLGKN